jgi:hypothetical protein
VITFSASVLNCSEEILGFVQRRMFAISEVQIHNEFINLQTNVVDLDEKVSFHLVSKQFKLYLQS